VSKRTRLEGRTLRRRRSREKALGTADRPRMSVFISNRQVYTQIINDADGRTLASASSLDKNLRDQLKSKPMVEVCGAVGKSIAEASKEAGIERIVFDKSGYRYGKRLSALADAARKEGLKF